MKNHPSTREKCRHHELISVEKELRHERVVNQCSSWLKALVSSLLRQTFAATAENAFQPIMSYIFQNCGRKAFQQASLKDL
jgi:hypothetical protein